MIHSRLRYVLPLVGLLFVATPAAAQSYLGDTTLAEYVNHARDAQVFYLSGALEVSDIFITCPSEFSVGQVRDTLRAYAQLGKLSLKTKFTTALWAVMVGEFGCRLRDGVTMAGKVPS
jgi:hypothetical protein